MVFFIKKSLLLSPNYTVLSSIYLQITGREKMCNFLPGFKIGSCMHHIKVLVKVVIIYLDTHNLYSTNNTSTNPETLLSIDPVLYNILLNVAVFGTY